jgi:hypothetical protein
MPHAARQLVQYMADHLQDCVETQWMLPDIAKLSQQF